MSIATKQRQCEERSSPKHQQSKVTPPPPPQKNNPDNHEKQPQQQQKQWNPGKSIAIDNQTQATIHVTKKSKQLTKQTPVASTESVNKKGGHCDKKRNTETLATTEGNIQSELKEVVSGEQVQYSDIYETSPDYRIYQNGKVNDFFQGESANGGDKPKSISDVCLVNDHFILVKMPSSEVNTQHSTNHTQELPRSNRKLCHYLSNKRNRVRKIVPINEEPEDFELSEKDRRSGGQGKSKSSHCLNVHSCWQTSASNVEELEVYQTRTKIHKTSSNSQLIDVEKSENKSTKTYQLPAKTDNNNVLEDIKEQEVQSISGTCFTSSLHDRVTLQNQPSLVGSDNNNVDISYCRKSCTPPRRRKCPNFESFYWLLRPFRGKYRKPKPKIQAVVYKTYFVKWTKPPEILNHGYGGVKSTELCNIGTSVIRRCRSAIF